MGYLMDLLKVMERFPDQESCIDIPRKEFISELTTLGVIGKAPDGMCQIVNPIYQDCILQTFKPEVNGLDQDYYT